MHPPACGRVRTLVLVDTNMLVWSTSQDFQRRSRYIMEGVRIAGISDETRLHRRFSTAELAQVDFQRIELLEAVGPHVVVTTPIILARLC